MSSAGGDSRYNPYSPGSSGWSILRNEEFQEVDVWGVTWQRKDVDSYSAAAPISNSSIFSRRQPPSTTAAFMIPKPISSSSSPISPIIMNEPNTFQQSSAPVNIPDWSKIYGKNPTGHSDGGGGGGGGSSGEANRNSWDDSDEDDEMMVPPHEWVARKVATRGQISSFSVYEGIGRTLKGRDLSNVRNAVLTKTGFLE